MKNLEKFDELVQSLSKLPTIGKKTALRLAYFIALGNKEEGFKLAHNIENVLRYIKSCSNCGGLSENELCDICIDEERDKNILCIVKNPKDIFYIEDSKSFDGFYFVLDNLNEEKLNKLKNLIVKLNTKELIFALTHEIDSDAIIFFIEDRLKDFKLNFSKIAQGIPSGVNLENVDFISLNKAIKFRTKLE